jgi:hypothetical protein
MKNHPNDYLVLKFPHGTITLLKRNRPKSEMREH